MKYGDNLKPQQQPRKSYYDKWMQNLKERDSLETMTIAEALFSGKPTLGYNTNLFQKAKGYYDQYAKEKNLWKDSNDYLDYIYQMLMEPGASK